MGRPPKLEGSRARDITPTVVRLEPNMRNALIREAHIAGRSLSAEITLRLKKSLKGPQGALNADQAWGANEGAAPYATQAPAANDAADGEVVQVPGELPGEQRLLLRLFNSLTPEKQLALLTLLKR